MSPLTRLTSSIKKSIFRRAKRTAKWVSAKASKNRTSQHSYNAPTFHPKQQNGPSSDEIQSQHPQRAVLENEPFVNTAARIQNSGSCSGDLTAPDSTTANLCTAAATDTLCPFPLLDLPFEIRRRVLEFALPYATSNELFGNVWCLGDTSILQTCHQLHVEGTQVLYATNPLNCVLDIGRCQSFFCVRHLYPSADSGESYRGSVTCSFNHCRDALHWGRVWERQISPEMLGQRNIALMRHWVLEIMGYNDLAGQLRYEIPDVAALTETIRDRVEETVKGLLSRADTISKVTVQWKGTDPDTYTNEVENQKRILEPLRGLGVLIEEDMSFLEAL